MSVIKAVLWDMDGTLVDSEPVHHASLSNLLTRLGHPVDHAFAAQFLGTPLVDIHADLSRRFGISLGIDGFARELYTSYFDSTHLLKPRPGALEAWRLLAARGMLQAVVSNADRLILDANLRAIGLTAPDFISVSINDVRRGKPAPDSYLRAAYLLDIAPEQCVVVEDSPVGAQAGLAAGMRVVGWPEHDDLMPRFPKGINAFRGNDPAAFILSI